MKKSLLAVAAMGAFASAAQAQSSVTMYGILDAGYVGGNQRLQSPSTVTGTNNNGFAISGAESTSRLGFKGVEDLGGGKSAFFTVEVTLSGDSATVLGGTRQAFVGLKDNKLGAASIGTQNTIVHNAVGATDPGAQNNVTGNVIYAASTNQTSTGTTAYGQTDAYTVRTSQTLKYESPVFAGFKANATYALNNDNTSQTGAYNVSGGSSNGGTSNYNGWGLGADYTFQKFYATANYQALKSVTPYGTGTTTSNPYTPADSAWTATTGGSNTQDNQAYVAATYDFGILKAYGQWISRKATAVQSSNYYTKRTAQQLGVRSFITPTVEAWASLGNGRWTAFGQNQPTANFTGYQVGSNYYLSKRTNLYAIFGSTETSSVSGSGAASQNNYAVGVRHTF